MLFSKSEEQRIVAAIREAESRTSGEIRLFVEPFCMSDDPVQKAAQLFELLGMTQTQARNGVLLYLAYESKHFAVWGDTGIHERVGFDFWDEEKKLLRKRFQEGEIVSGLCEAILQIGEQLSWHFPADQNSNRNELPDEIIYG